MLNFLSVFLTKTSYVFLYPSLFYFLYLTLSSESPFILILFVFCSSFFNPCFPFLLSFNPRIPLLFSLSPLSVPLSLFSLPPPPWSGDTLTSPGQATQREESFEGQVKILSEQLKEVTAYWDRPCLRILFFPYCNILFLSFFFGPGSNFFFIIYTWFRVYLSCCIS